MFIALLVLMIGLNVGLIYWVLAKARVPDPQQTLLTVSLFGPLCELLRISAVGMSFWAVGLAVAAGLGYEEPDLTRGEFGWLSFMIACSAFYCWAMWRHCRISATREHLYVIGTRYDWREVGPITRNFWGVKLQLPRDWWSSPSGELPIYGWNVTKEDVERLNEIRAAAVDASPNRGATCT